MINFINPHCIFVLKKLPDRLGKSKVNTISHIYLLCNSIELLKYVLQSRNHIFTILGWNLLHVLSVHIKKHIISYLK